MGFFDSLKTGVSAFFDSSFGNALGTTIGQGVGAFAVQGGQNLANRFFGGNGSASGSPFAGIPTQQFCDPRFQNCALPGTFGNVRGPLGTPRAPGFPVPAPPPQFPIPFNPLLPSPANPNAGFAAALPFATAASFSGAPNMAFPTTRNFGFQQAAFDLPFIDIVPQGAGALVGGPGGGGGSLTSPFRPTMAGAAAQPFIATNPVTGRPTWFRTAGRPILFSGDLSTCRRVEKVARRARKATRKR